MTQFIRSQAKVWLKALNMTVTFLYNGLTKSNQILIYANELFFLQGRTPTFH